MDPPIPAVRRCCSTQTNGYTCNSQLAPGVIRCARHQKVFASKDPRTFVVNEIKYKVKRMRATWAIAAAGLDMHQMRMLHRKLLDWRNISMRTFSIMTDADILALLLLGGAWYIRGHPEPISETGQIMVELIVNPPRQNPARQNPPRQNPARHNPPPENRNITRLGRFAADKQNIHTTRVVQSTKDVCERMLRINVPAEYRWNLTTCSKTPGEIISECKLSVACTSQLMARYLQPEDIYEMGVGIYGRVLDGVWQYIRNSPEKAELCKILANELQDNVGMCLQGNLTRICNCLSGYLDGVTTQESHAQILGREFPKLLEITDIQDRIAKAKHILEDIGVPTAEWSNWLDALSD